MKEIARNDQLTSTTNCGVCGRPLVYGTDAVIKKCSLCGREDSTLIYCPAGHYVCDTCHSKASLEVLREVLERGHSSDPVAIFEQVVAHPSVPMHGPEHHVIVPAVIVSAVKNAGYNTPRDAIDKVIGRAVKVPGGWCGLYGDCGAAVGTGIAVSVLTEATPLTGKPRTLALGATSQALARMLDGQPRCCKKASRTAILSTIDYLHDRLGIDLIRTENTKCHYTIRNRECARSDCPYFDGEIGASSE